MFPEAVLVTGPNGFIGLHVLNHALKRGWNVVAPVRSDRAVNRITSIFPAESASSQIKIVKIQGIVKSEYFKPAFEAAPVTAVINTASPIVYDVDDVAADILHPAIDSATAILEASAAYGGSSLKRVVHVSSGGAVMDPTLGPAPGKNYTWDDWNPVTFEQAVAGGAQLAYITSKGLSEKAFWKWLDDHSSAGFDLVSVAPAAVFGPQFLGALEGKETVDLKGLPLSLATIWSIAFPGAETNFHMGGWVYVGDRAESLARAVTTPEASGLRILATERCHWQLIRDVARRVVPELKGRIDEGEPGLAEREKDSTYDMDGSRLTSVLGVDYTPIDVALKEAYEQILAAEKAQS